MTPSSPAVCRPAQDPRPGHESRSRERTTSGGCENERLRYARQHPDPRVVDPRRCVPAGAQLGKNETDMVRQKAVALEEDLLSGSGWPSFQNSFALSCNSDRSEERRVGKE